MSQPSTDSAIPGDNLVLPFRTDRSGVSGRVVRLGALVDQVLTRHDYPEPVSEALGQALALTALIGNALKFDGTLVLQTRSDGPLGFLVTDFASPGQLRGYAAFDAARTAQHVSDTPKDQGRLFGAGHLALTINPGGQLDRYQGIVALEAQSLTEAAQTYFRQSEQLPTFLRLAVARHYSAADKTWSWRAGGLMLQFVSPVGGIQKSTAAAEEESRLVGEDEDDWQRMMILASTVEDHELLDPMLSPEHLLFRLFHQEDVRTHAAVPLAVYCRCSTERVATLMRSFPPADLADMREADGHLAVKCEFCTTTYRLREDEIG